MHILNYNAAAYISPNEFDLYSIRLYNNIIIILTRSFPKSTDIKIFITLDIG